jgi:hypothetical protein
MHRCIAELRESPAPNKELFARMRRAWGNEGFSADSTYVTEVARRVMASPGPVLECGSGLTTLVAGVLAEKRGLEVVSLEQDRDWAAHIHRALRKHDLETVRVEYAPLREYSGYVWYDVSGIQLPAMIDLVLCDGPAVFDNWGRLHEKWRYGVLPVLKERGISIREILLDDVDEPRAADLLKSWQQDFGTNHRIFHSADGDCAEVVVN